MHCHCGTNNRAPMWTFTHPCIPEARSGVREESASPAWLAAPAMNVRNTTKVYIWRIETGCGPPLYRKCHSHNTPVNINMLLTQKITWKPLNCSLFLKRFISLCPKSPSARGFVASLPVHLLFKSV